MLSEYHKLITDVRVFIEEAGELKQTLLTKHHFTPPPLPTKKPVDHNRLPPPSSPPLPCKPAVQKEPLSKPLPNHHQELPQNHFKNLLKQLAPQIKVIEEIPLEKRASVNNLMEPFEEFTFLSFNEPEEERLLLENIAQALRKIGKPAAVVKGSRLEREDLWPTLIHNPQVKIILSPPVISNWPRLYQYYQEHSLGGKPLILLEPLSSYFNNPALKRSLWQKLSMLP